MAMDISFVNPLTISQTQTPESVLPMILGIECLLVSVLCFAAASQPRAVWLVCIVLTGVVAFDAILMTLQPAFDEEARGELLLRLDRMSKQQRHG